MNKDLQITLKMEGTENEEGFVTLSDFMDRLSALKESLDAVDRAITDERRTTLYYRIVDVSKNSPLSIVIEPVKKRACSQRDSRAQIQNTHHQFFDTLATIKRGEIPAAHFNSPQIEALQRLVGNRDGKFSSLEIKNNTSVITVDKQLEDAVTNLSNLKEYSQGSVEGRLETINLHGKTKRFIVYPFTGPTKVSCEIPKRLIESAKLALDKRVIVRGKKHYHPFDDFPHFIEADEIEIIDSEPLDIHSTRGVIGTGNLTSVELLGDMRDDW